MIRPQTMVLVAMVAGSFAIVQAETITWRTDSEAALAEAQQRGTPVLVLVTAGAWCDPCVWLDENVLDRPEVVSLVNAGFIPVRIPDSDPGWRHWEVQRLPSMIILGSDGEEMRRIRGAVSSQVLLSALAPLAGSGRRSAAVPSENDATRDGLRGAVFRLGVVGTLWNDGGAIWYSQDAGLPPRLEEYDRDETFLYLRDVASATLLGVPVEPPAQRGAVQTLWRWDLQARRWQELLEMSRLD